MAGPMTSGEPTSARFQHFTFLVNPGEQYETDPFLQDFCLTDIVLTAAADSEGTVIGEIRLKPTISDQTFNSALLPFRVTLDGFQVHFISGILCPKGFRLNVATQNQGVSAGLWVLLSGYFR